MGRETEAQSFLQGWRLGTTSPDCSPLRQRYSASRPGDESPRLSNLGDLSSALVRSVPRPKQRGLFSDTYPNCRVGWVPVTAQISRRSLALLAIRHDLESWSGSARTVFSPFPSWDIRIP